MSNANVLTPNNMFHTPDSWKEVVDWIEAHPREDRIHLYTAAVMAWNLAAKITNEETEVANSWDGHEHESETMQLWSHDNG